MGLLIRVLSFFFCLLPLGWAMAIGRLLGRIWYYLLPVRRGVALENVERALGQETSASERRRIVRKSFEHLTMMAVESLRMPALTLERAEELLRRENFEVLFEALEEKKGVVAVLAHIGNFEMLAATQGMRGIPLHAVVKEIKNRGVQRFVEEVRERTKYRTVPPRRSRDQIRAILANDEIVSLLVDQHLPAHRAIVCEFFGQLAATTPAPTRFALENGAPIVLCTTFRDPNRPGYHVARFEPRFELESPYDDDAMNLWHNTQRLNRVVEKWIREHPENYFWVHKRWKVHDNPEGWDIPEPLRHLCAR